MRYKTLNDHKNKPLAGELTRAQGKQIADAIRKHKANPTADTYKALKQITGSPLAAPIWRG